MLELVKDIEFIGNRNERTPGKCPPVSGCCMHDEPAKQTAF